MYALTWAAFLWLVAALFEVGVAAFVYFARPDRLQNRLLGLALGLDGLSWLMIASRIASIEPRFAHGSVVTQIAFLVASIFAYVAFLGTLNTGLTRPLAGKGIRWTLAVAGVATFGFLVIQPRHLYPTPSTPIPGPWRWGTAEVGTAGVVIVGAHILVLLFALVASLTMWLRTPRGTPTRSRAGWYVAAFGVRDVAVLADWIVQNWLLLRGLDPSEIGQTAWARVEIAYLPASLVAFSALIAYGVLRHQLFDIDLKIKWTLRRGTVAAAFLAVFFVVSQLIEALAGTTLGTVAGAVAAGLLLFFIAPLQRMAERVAEAAMPRVRDTHEYRLVRKQEVYRAAVESALRDGRISDKERDVLATLADQLGLSSTDSLRLEREASKGH